jgi:amino acid adenylation domain-containing protein/FkbM family methyltransferase
MSTQVIEGFSLSPQQKLVWRRQAGGAPLGVAATIRLEGTVEAEGLRQAVERVSHNAEILRTQFRRLPSIELPLQVIEETARPAFRHEDLSPLAPERRETRLAELWDEITTLADPEAGPVLRGLLATCGAGESWLLLSLPVLCSDTAGLRNLVREIGREYAAGPAGAEPDEGSLQYADFSDWQNDLLEAEEAAEGRAWWRERLAALPPPPDLPFERRPEGGTGGLALHNVPVELAPGAPEQIEALAQRSGTPVEAVLLAAFAALLGQAGGRSELTLSRLHSCREAEQLAGALGLYARYLPLAVPVQLDRRLWELAGLIEEAIAANASWQEVFPSDLQGQDAGICTRFEEWPDETFSPGVRAHLERLSGGPDRCSLELTGLRRGERGTSLALTYDPGRYAKAHVEQLAASLAALLEGALAEPEATLGDLPLLGPADREQVLEAWSRGPVAARPEHLCVHHLIAEQARRAPEADAVVFRGESLSHGELESRANCLARHLRRLGVGPDVPVGLALERSVDLIVGLLAIWKAGGAYVPLDPALPPERIAFLLEDTGAPAYLTQERLASALAGSAARAVVLEEMRDALAAESDAPLEVAVDAENLAYILYTSGSTGRPKGVMVRHGSLLNLAEALRETVYAGLPSPLRVGVNASLGFDASVKQVVQLCHGHALHLVPEEERLDGARLLSFIERQRLDVLDCTPTQLRVLLEAGLRQRPELAPPLVLIGGEALDDATWAFLATCGNRSFFNVYGPTECTVDATAARIATDSGPVLGRPLPNMRTYVLDDRLRPLPAGMTGELCIGGAGLARGYLGRPDLTAERFIPDPWGGELGGCLYRSGDLSRFLSDGRIEFLGRRDHQVKVRGVRIELEEIEGVLADHPGVQAAAVSLRPGETGDARLAAYVVPRRRFAATVEGRHRLALPNGMAVAHQNRNETEYLYQELFEHRIYLRHGIELPADACVFDVGANIGLFSLLVARSRPQGRVFAFEPIAPIFDTLRINVDLYGGPQVKIFPFGLSATERAETFMFYPRYSMMSGLSSYAVPHEEAEVVKRFLENMRQSGAAQAGELLGRADELLAGRFEGEACPGLLRRLSDVIREEGVERIDLLKIDVQRAEMDVLHGLDEADWRRVRQLVLEVHDPDGPESDGRLREMTALFARHGFETLIEQDELLEGTDRYNLYAVRPEDGRRLVREVDPPRWAEADLPGSPLLTAEELRAHLRRKLPEAMVPSAFVLLDALPVTRNGKVDRRALPDPESLQPEQRADLVPPRNEAEAIIVRIWREVLQRERIGVHDNFFDLGGHSLLLLQVHTRLGECFDRPISMLDLFQHPTVSALAGFLAGEQQEDPLAGIDEEARLQLEAMERQRIWMEQEQEL